MDVKQKFIELTQKTYPHGMEDELVPYLPNYLKNDEFGNLYHKIGENPSTMFTCHLDTASYDVREIKHIIDGNIVKSDGTTILGADDKAGVTILLYMMYHNVPGLYYFFLGEERGCIGSKKVSNIDYNNPKKNISKVVSFDRRGYDSVITHQMSGRCCSEEFANELSQELNRISGDIFKYGFQYRPDPTGIYTDSAQFTHIYSECTNISVGYQYEHTTSEQQDIDFLKKLCEVVIHVKWDDLNTYRKIGKYQYDDDDYYSDYGFGISNSYNYSYESKSNDDFFSTDDSTTTEVILDEEYYGYESTIKYKTFSKEIIDVKLHPDRINKEKVQIDNLLTNLEIPYEYSSWNGNYLIIKQDAHQDIYLERSEVCEYLNDLNNWISNEISDKRKNYI